MNPAIYHGTPLTPRAALLDVCKGRAMCVSFHHPQDVEAVEAISPAIMFRQRRVFILAGGITQRAGMGRASRLDALLSVAGGTAVSPRQMGSHSRYAGSAQPAQRRTTQRMAIRTGARRSPVAHGRAFRSAWQAVRAIRPRCLGMDWASEKGTCGLPSLSPPHGRGRDTHGQSLAPCPHDARSSCCVRLPIPERRQHFPGTERTPL